MGRRPNRDLIENTLGWTSLLRGDLISDGALQINGWIEGSVESRAAIVIGASGAVRGHVLGVDVVVAGKVFGNVTCSGHLEILATGRIEGDIDAQSVRVETGGVLLGASRMGTQADEIIEASDESSAEALAAPSSATADEASQQAAHDEPFDDVSDEEREATAVASSDDDKSAAGAADESREGGDAIATRTPALLTAA